MVKIKMVPCEAIFIFVKTKKRGRRMRREDFSGGEPCTQLLCQDCQKNFVSKDRERCPFCAIGYRDKILEDFESTLSAFQRSLFRRYLEADKAAGAMMKSLV